MKFVNFFESGKLYEKFVKFNLQFEIGKMSIEMRKELLEIGKFSRNVYNKNSYS